jgi:hypothetical protein
VDELGAQLLASRGSVEDDERQRSRRARAIIRAAAELETAVSPIRFAAYTASEGHPPLVAISAEGAEYARRLARTADVLAVQDPLPSPGRVDEELGLVPVPNGAEPLAPDRRLRLAVAASKDAALSARGELYPRGMSPLTALRLSLGTLASAGVLREDEIRARVQGRFPEASPLPPRPDLDVLLEKAEAGIYPRIQTDLQCWA